MRISLLRDHPKQTFGHLHTLILKTPQTILYNRQVGVAQQKGAKNLAEVESRIERWATGATTTAKSINAKIKGKLVELAWWMKKQGYADQSIRTYLTCLRVLHNQGANLFEQESVKDAMARQKWSNNRKRIAINAYTLFLKINGLHWEKPKCKVTRKIPFIPTEQELDALIAGCGRKTATFLQLLKETAMRAGEAKRLLWTDIDFEKRLITLNLPEKGGNPRIWKVSPKLTAMLNALPKQSLKVFGDGPINSLKTTFLKARKRLAAKLQNPRLLKISFHTFRHWKATMIYHKTKDPMYVKEFLGHKKLDTTLLYIQIEQALYSETNDDFIVKVARTPQQIKALLEVGFEYVCQKEDLLFFRKRK
jgi:integrase